MLVNNLYSYDFVATRYIALRCVVLCCGLVSAIASRFAHLIAAHDCRISHRVITNLVMLLSRSNDTIHGSLASQFLHRHHSSIRLSLTLISVYHDTVLHETLPDQCLYVPVPVSARLYKLANVSVQPAPPQYY